MAVRPGGGSLRSTPQDELEELRRLASEHIDDWQAVVDRVDAELQRRSLTPLPIPDASV
jgi:hypothetical protein